MILSKLLNQVSKIDGIASVTGDEIPGPPPNHLPVIIINSVASDYVSSSLAQERLASYRRIASHIVRLVKIEIPVDYGGTISLRIFNSQSRCRDYCLNATNREVHGTLDMSFSGHESSQDLSIESLIVR